MATPDSISPDLVADEINVFYLLISGYLVFFMQAGFAMLSAGSVRSKNVKNILLKNLLDACFGALGFYILGYGFAYGTRGDESSSTSKFIGYKFGFAHDDISGGTLAEWFFQYAFAATAATIVSGAVAERAKFEAYLLYALFLTMWVYPVVVHWIWSPEGWASAFVENFEKFLGVGVIDFAGCGVVHMTGGFAALAGAAVLGPRIGRFDSKGNVIPIPGHSTALAILGVFILWFGWFGFNPGSTLGLTLDGEGLAGVAANCAVTTTLAAAAGTISCMVMGIIESQITQGHVIYDLIASSNGTLAGLVGITAGCSVVHGWAAIIIGGLAGIIYFFASKVVIGILKVDDPLDAIAVHGVCGAWGLLGAALFYDDNLYQAAYSDAAVGKRGEQFAANLIIIFVIAAWVLGNMVPFFLLTNVTGLLRVAAEEEHEGLDTSHHEGSAYPEDPVKQDKEVKHVGEMVSDTH